MAASSSSNVMIYAVDDKDLIIIDDSEFVSEPDMTSVEDTLWGEELMIPHKLGGRTLAFAGPLPSPDNFNEDLRKRNLMASSEVGEPTKQKKQKALTIDEPTPAGTTNPTAAAPSGEGQRDKEKANVETIHAQIPSVDLPSLKFLHLESVTFTHNEYLIKILSACPVLEELETKDLTVKEIYRVHPECPDTYVTGLSKLSRANISGQHILYDCLDNAKHLQLHVTIHNMFHNLTYMELALDIKPVLGLLKWSWVMKMLQKSPKLQTLIIHEVGIVDTFDDEDY
ncbi:hypothetical protein P8452_39940 [Trifolium repens]|nr:hypothetical protein P8452_39940 [Trifolium repens]